MNFIKEFLKTHQQKIVLSIGYVLVAILGIGIGRITAQQNLAPEIKIEEVFAPPVAGPLNNTANQGIVQSASTDTSVDNCNGRIKGNISSTNKIYHVPGGSFYNRTNPEACFSTEQEAQAAGFRKSSR